MMTAYHPYRGKRHLLRSLILTLLLLGILCFGVLEVIVLAGGRDTMFGAPKVMIVLGAKVESWGPSVLLRDRLDEALDYLEDHPDLTVVVSGGQGSNEPMTEARAMRDYLVEHGAAEDRILLEERSHNTWQNLKFSYALLREQGYEEQMDSVLVVSNGFHLARVRLLFPRVWENGTLSTLAAPSSHLGGAVYSYLREPAALIKSFVVDR
ncbi:MAG: YdcF family protein [Oscillospiraceae bacterium]|nr:YdcF family protein [Oscillospiraceae bacterium]